MNHETYTFGGVTLEIRTEIPLHHAPKYDIFLAHPDAVPDYTIEIVPTPSDSDCGRTIPAPVERDGSTIRVKINRDDIPGISAANVFSAVGVPCLFVEHDAFILHSSYVLHEGKAILFTAPSGTGKSTQATFWKEHRQADVINGDRTLVTYKDGKFCANGIYASGKSGLCQNITSPIGAVILLEQGSRNEIRRIPARELFMRIVNQCGFDMKSVTQQEKITELVAELINSVPVYCYACRNHPDSVDDLERYLWNNRK